MSSPYLDAVDDYENLERKRSLSIDDEIAGKRDKQEALTDAVKERMDEGSIALRQGRARKFVDTSIDVGLNVGQDLAENASTIIYSTVKGLQGPEEAIQKYRLQSAQNPKLRSLFGLETKLDPLTKEIGSYVKEYNVSDEEALEMIRERNYLAQDPKRTRDTYKKEKIAEAKEFYNNWTDKVGALSVIIPPPRPYGEAYDYAWEDSDYAKKYKIDDPEGIAGNIVLGVGKLIAVTTFLKSLSNPMKASKSYKTLQKELGKTRAARIKNLVDKGKLGKAKQLASKVTTGTGKLAVGGIVAGELAFDPREDNFADFIANIPKEYQTGFVEDIVNLSERLQETPEDSALQARLKSTAVNAMSNVVVGGLFAGFFKVSGTLTKQVKIPEKVDDFIQKRITTKNMTDRKRAEDEVDRIEKEGLDTVPDENIDASPETLILPTFKSDPADEAGMDFININMSKLDDEGGVEKVINEIQKQSSEGKVFNFEGRGKSSWGKTKKGSDELYEENLNDVLKAVQEKRLTPELVNFMRELLVIQTESLGRARDAVLKAARERGSVTPQEEGLLLQEAARFTKILTHLTGMTSNAGRVLDAFKMPIKGTKLKKMEDLVKLNRNTVEELTRKNILDRAGERTFSRAGDIIDFAENLETMNIYKDLPDKFRDGFVRSFMKKTTAYMYNSILSDASTAKVNFYGSGALQFAETYLTKPIAYGIGVAKAAVGKTKFLGYEGPRTRVKAGQVVARGIGGLHGLVVGAVQFGRAFVRGDMLPELKAGGEEIDRLAKSQGFTPFSIETGFMDGKPKIMPATQTKEAFGRIAESASTAKNYAIEAYNSIKKGKIGQGLSYGLTSVGNIARVGLQSVNIGFGTVISIPMRTLLGGDAMMKQTAKTAHLYEEAYVEASKKFNPKGKIINTESVKNTKKITKFVNDYVANPSAEANERSLNKAAIDTFTNTNILADKIQDIVGKPGDALHFITRPFIPFVQTVTNLYDRAFLYSPLAPMKKEFREDLVVGGDVADTAVARMAVGTGLVTMGYQGASGFLQTYSSVAKERDVRIRGTGLTVDYPFLNTRKAGGWHALTIELDNPKTGQREAREYSRLDPFAFQIAIGADINDMINMIQYNKETLPYYDNIDIFSAAISALGISTYKNILERNPLLQGIEAMGSAFLGTQRGFEGDAARPGEAALRAFADPVLGIFTNALGRRIDREGFLGWDQIQDENHTGYLRDTHLLMDKAKYAMHTHAVVAGFGEWSRKALNIDDIPFKFNIITGDYEVNQNSLNKNKTFWESMIEVSKKHVIKDDKVAKELVALGFSKKRINPTIINPDTGIPIKLNQGAYQSYQFDVTGKFREGFSFYMNSPRYKEMRITNDVQGQKDMAQKAWREALEFGKNQYFHFVGFSQSDPNHGTIMDARDIELEKQVRTNRRTWESEID